MHAADAGTRAPDVQVGLLVFLGRMQRERLGKLDDAAASYRAALALEPETTAALDDLITIHRTRGDSAGLAEALRHRGGITQDMSERRAAFAEVAQIRERAGDRDGAIAAWREITDHDDGDREALDELARIYRAGGGDAATLIDVLGRAARLASNEADEKTLRVEIARLEGDSPRAVAAWQVVLDLDADDVATLACARGRPRARRRLARGQRHPTAPARAREVERRQARDPRRDGEARRDQARFARRRGRELVRRARHRQRVSPGVRRARAAARRRESLAQSASSDLLERLAELEGTLGNGSAELAVLARAADIWEGKLDSPDAAGEILEKILAREPGSIAALTRLSKIYERSGDWAKCKATLEQALKISGGNASARDAADLFFRLGEVARVGDGELDTAVLHYQQALVHVGDHAGAIAALETIARERRDTTLLADMLGRRAGLVVTPTERVAVLVELGQGAPRPRPATPTRRSRRCRARSAMRRPTRACSARWRISTSPPAASTRPRRSTTSSPTTPRPAVA